MVMEDVGKMLVRTAYSSMLKAGEVHRSFSCSVSAWCIYSTSKGSICSPREEHLEIGGGGFAHYLWVCCSLCIVVMISYRHLF